MYKIIVEIAAMRRQLEEMDKTLINLFNNGNPGQYDGDPLFQPTHSPICKYWIPRGNDEEELFMNFNCGHPDAECDWGDGDHCAIISCLDEEEETQLAGQIAATHSQIHPLMMQVLDMFNTYNKQCAYRLTEGGCAHRNNKDHYCCAADCPL